MKVFALICSFVLVILACNVCIAQAGDTANQSSAIHTDSSSTNNKAIVNDELDDFSPGLLFFALFGIVFMFAAIGFGIGLAIVLPFIVFALVSIGIVSASVIIGFYKKSFDKGFKALLNLSFCISGFCFGAILLFLINNYFNWWQPGWAVLTGACMGTIAGFIASLISFRLLQRIATYFKKQLKVTL